MLFVRLNLSFGCQNTIHNHAIVRDSNSGFVTIAVPQETLEDLEISMMSDAVMNFDRRGNGKGKGKGKVRTPEKKKNEGEPEYAVGVDYKHGMGIQSQYSPPHSPHKIHVVC